MVVMMIVAMSVSMVAFAYGLMAMIMVAPGPIGLPVRVRLVADVGVFAGLKIGQRRFAGPAAQGCLVL